MVHHLVYLISGFRPGTYTLYSHTFGQVGYQIRLLLINVAETK